MIRKATCKRKQFPRMRRGVPGLGPQGDARDPRVTKLRRQKLPSELSFSGQG